MKKFRSSKSISIEEFEVLKETEKQIIFINQFGKEIREAKESNWNAWHESKEDAINYLIANIDSQILATNKRLEYLSQQKTKASLL